MQPLSKLRQSDGGIAVDVSAARLVPAQDWCADSGDGLRLSTSDEPEAQFVSAPVIAIDFGSFTDGRGLSLAVLLRTRYGFTGELRAIGDVHPDLLHYMKRCGFDTFLIPAVRELPIGANATRNTFAPYTDYYQASALQPEPSYRRNLQRCSAQGS